MKDQPAVRKEMEGNNRKKILEQYSWHKVAEMYQNTYRGKAPGKAYPTRAKLIPHLNGYYKIF